MLRDAEEAGHQEAESNTLSNQIVRTVSADALMSASVCVAYYVTGHGLGHGTRVAEVRRVAIAFLDLPPGQTW